jgi:hypothetical protein
VTTTPIVHSQDFSSGFMKGRRYTQWEVAAHVFDEEPDLHRTVEAVYFGEHCHYPEAIAAILWDNFDSGRRDVEEVVSLRADLMHEAVSGTAGDWDLEELSKAVDARLRERAGNEAAFSNYWRLAVESNERSGGA